MDGAAAERGGAAWVEAVFAGGLSGLGDGELSGIRKRLVAGAVRVGPLGLQGDQIADRRVHGGPDKAVCMFALEQYQGLTQRFPDAVEPFAPGGFGENLCCVGLRDDAVCIGDVYRIGGALLQVCQPRKPCWKLNDRFGIEQLSRHVQDQRITGWYARVLEPGELAAGDAVSLVERAPDARTLAGFWDAVQGARPDPEALAALARQRGLAADWARRLAQRAQWLRDNAPA